MGGIVGTVYLTVLIYCWGTIFVYSQESMSETKFIDVEFDTTTVPEKFFVPQVEIYVPNKPYYNYLPTLSGKASTPVPLKIQHVKLTVSDITEKTLFWDGSVWLAEKVWLSAILSTSTVIVGSKNTVPFNPQDTDLVNSTGTILLYPRNEVLWYYISPAWQDGHKYQIIAFAIDNQGHRSGEEKTDDLIKEPELVIKLPRKGVQVKNNRVSVMAEIVGDAVKDIKNVRFEYMPENGTQWKPVKNFIPQKVGIDLLPPESYTLFWDISQTREGKYRLRVLGYNIKSGIDVNSPTISFDIIYPNR